MRSTTSQCRAHIARLCGDTLIYAVIRSIHLNRYFVQYTGAVESEQRFWTPLRRMALAFTRNGRYDR
jgi:hypothetical protein